MDERQAYTELYRSFNLEQLESRLSLAHEAVADAQIRLNTHLIRVGVLQQLIEKERERLTQYYENTAAQEFPYDYDTLSKNDEERDLQEEHYRDRNKEI